MKKIILTLFAFSSSLIALQAQYTFEWSAQFKGENVDHAYGIAVDTEGSVITGGDFYLPIDFDPSEDGEAILTATSPPNGFVCKLDADGNYLWAKNIPGESHVLDVCTDQDNNIYACGWFKEEIEELQIASVGQWDMFLVKYSSTGEFLWANSFGGDFNDLMRTITTDEEGNVLVSGEFRTTVDFDPGIGVAELTDPSAVNSYDAFVAKYDSEGNYIWVRPFTGEGLQHITSLAINSEDDLIIGGYFSTDIDCDPGAGQLIYYDGGNLDWQAFIVKLDQDANLVWAKSFGGISHDLINGLALDAQDNIYSTGSFVQTADFDPSDGVFEMTTPLGLSDPFVMKLNTQGEFVWAKAYAGGETSGGYAIAAINGMIYTTGTVTGDCDFDPGEGVVELIDKNGADIFIAVLDSDGNYEWAYRTGGFENDFGRAIAVNEEYMYVAGDFRHIAVYFGSEFYYSEGFEDPFIVKIKYPTGVSVSEISETMMSIYPNPANDRITIQQVNASSNTIGQVTITDYAGRVVWQSSQAIQNTSIDVSHFADGIYMMTVQQENAVSNQRVIVAH